MLRPRLHGFAFVVLVVSFVTASSPGCKGDGPDPCSAVARPFDVGDADGHPEPLGSGSGEARAGRVEASELPPTPTNLASWEAGDFVLANDRIAVVIEDVDDSDLYDPWGGRPVGFARVRDGAMVDGSDFGEMLLFAFGPSTVVTEHVGVVDDGSDGSAAIVRAEGRLSPIPFIFNLVRVFWSSETYRDVVTRVAIDYVLEPGAEHVDVRIRIKHTDETGMIAGYSEAVGFMFGDRLRSFQPTRGIGFDSSDVASSNLIAFVDDVGVGYAFESPDERLAPLPSTSGFSGGVKSSYFYPGCKESAEDSHLYGRIHVGGPDADALLDAVARSRGESTRAITGRVVDGSGTGRAGVRVHAVRAGGVDYYLSRSRTDAAGNYVLHVPAGESVDVYAYAAGEAFVGPAASPNGTAVPDLVVPATATVNVEAAVDQDGTPVPYKLQVLPGDGTTTIPAPPNAHFGESLPTTGRLHVVHALAGEDVSLSLPPGTWKLVASRGFRYELDESTVTVASGDVVPFAPVLDRTVDTPGVLCADFHIHTRRSNDSPDDATDKLRAGLAEDLDIPVRSDHEYVEDWDDVLTGPLGSGAFAIGVTSVEMTTMEYYGHFGVLPVDPDPSLPNGGTPLWQDYPTMADLDRPFRSLDPSELFAKVHARAEQPLVIVNHPLGGKNYFGWSGYDPVTGTGTAGRWSADFDAIEVFNSADWVGERNGTVRYWLSFLNRGVHMPAVGSSDTHDVMGSPMGYDRTCIDFTPDGITTIPQDPTVRREFGYVLRDAVAEGRAVVNGGIFVDANVGAVGPGGTATGLGANTTVHVRVRAISTIDVDTIEVVVDGQTAATIDVATECTQNGVVRCEQDVPIAVGTSNAYVVVAAHGSDPMEPLMRGRIPFGVTNPIYLAR